MLFSPQDHPLNPPSSWDVRKADTGHGVTWYLVDAYGNVMDRYKTRKAAEADKVSGPLVKLYDQERRWYAGEAVAGWKPYVPGSR
jgi:hypothetical protein